MSVDSDGRLAARVARPLADAARERYDRATADLDPPLALVDQGAFDRNAADMVRRGALNGTGVKGSLPIRVATKSLRCRYLIERALATPGWTSTSPGARWPAGRRCISAPGGPR